MHILQILPALEEGGVERGTVELNRELVRLGHTSSVISAGGHLASRIEADGGRHLPVDVKSKNPLTFFRRAARLEALLRESKPAVVHYRSRVPGWLFKYANRRLQLPFVSTVHGYNSVGYYSSIMVAGERVICPSSGLSEYIRHHYQVDPAKIHIVPRGVDPELFDPAKLDQAFMRNFREQHGLAGRLVVLAVGRLTQLKGYETLIEAVDLARVKLPRIKCIIAGGAEAARRTYAEGLQALVKERQLEHHLAFVGSQSKMAELYSCADVLVSCNDRKPEAFGRSMIEALSMECPVIATDLGGARDIVKPGVNGWLISPAAPQQLAEHLLLVAQHRFSGLRRDCLERFSLEQMVRQTLGVYREIIDERERGG